MKLNNDCVRDILLCIEGLSLLPEAVITSIPALIQAVSSLTMK